MLNKNNNLDQFWMPFTANRQFKAKPRLLESAAGMYFTSSDGRQVLNPRCYPVADRKSVV